MTKRPTILFLIVFTLLSLRNFAHAEDEDRETCEESGDAEICAAQVLASLLADDEIKSRYYLEKACQLNPRYCGGLANYYIEGIGGEKDTAKAIHYYQLACDAGYASNCYDLGIIYETGKLVPQDIEQARALYKKACTADSPYLPACYKLE